MGVYELQLPNQQTIGAAGFEKNWIPTVPGKAWFPYFRLYGPTEAHFNRTWVGAFGRYF